MPHTSNGIDLGMMANRTGLTGALDLNRGRFTTGVFGGTTWGGFKRDWFAGAKATWRF